MVQSLVLNVDSNPETRNAVSAILSQYGLHVRDVPSAADCLQLAETSEPDVIVIAPEPDDMRGAELCRRLSKVTSAMRILRLPSVFHDDLVRSIADCGADAYVPEAIKTAILASSVRSLLRVREEQRNRDTAFKALAEAHEELHVFLSRITHNMAEPIRAASTLVELIRQGGSDRLSAAEITYMEHVLAAMDGSRHLLHYLMAYSQIAREPASTQRNVKLQGVVVAAQSQLREDIDKAGADIRLEEMPEVFGNPAQLQSLMGAFLSNSIKYRGDRPPVIEIQAAREPGGRWQIAVKDNGIGIAPQYHETIFAPFQRLHGREIPGTGMGLALSRKIVESHGGKLWVESAPGKGATFVFTLPPGQP